MFRNKKISITTLIAICLCLLVAFGCSNNPENTDDFCFEHSYINGECEVCHAIDGGAIKYEFNNNSNSYEVVGLLSSYTPTEIVVLDEYNDGVNGKRDVTVVKENAFVANRFITKVVLPVTVKKIGANAFKECRALKTIIMTGVEELQNEDTFYNCLALEEIVVGDKFKAGREFTTNDIEHNPIADIFVKCGNSFSSNINFISNPDCFSGLLTGNVYYYSEENRCATWSYNQNGEIEKVEHEFKNGACSDCGADDCDDLVYVYNSTDSCYYLLGFKKGFNDEEIVVLESVDDGIHGYGEVKGILDFAFYGNQKIKKLILSSTINYLGDQCFFGCSKLEYVNMGGFIETGRVPLQSSTG